MGIQIKLCYHDKLSFLIISNRFEVYMKKVIITVTGPDKPGIIAGVSNVLYNQHCNIENISQTTLQSEFAGICLAAIPESLSIQELQAHMEQGLSGQNLQITIKTMDEETSNPANTITEPFIVSTFGPDRKGIVAVISQVIADAGVNISNLKAVFQGGDNPDRNIMIFEIDVPVSIDLQRFSAELSEKASAIGLDLNIQHKNIFDAVNRI